MKNVNLRVKHIYVGKKSRKGFTISLFTFGSKTVKHTCPPQAKFCPNICKQKITPEYLIGEKRRENASA